MTFQKHGYFGFLGQVGLYERSKRAKIFQENGSSRGRFDAFWCLNPIWETPKDETLEHNNVH